MTIKRIINGRYESCAESGIGVEVGNGVGRIASIFESLTGLPPHEQVTVAEGVSHPLITIC